MSRSGLVSSLLGAAALVITFVLSASAQQPPAPAGVVHGIDRADLDTTCAACQDFYQFATGGWQKANPAPPAFPRWGTFALLAERNRDVVRQVLDSAAAAVNGNHPASAIAKVGVFYATCMDSAGAESQGLLPAKPELARIAAITTVAGIRHESARLQSMFVPNLFGIGSQQDTKNSSEEILGVQQGGLGLPDRDYYLKTDSAPAATRRAYVSHIAHTLALAGDDSVAAGSAASRIMAIETSLARISRSRTERRDPLATYHRCRSRRPMRSRHTSSGRRGSRTPAHRPFRPSTWLIRISSADSIPCS